MGVVDGVAAALFFGRHHAGHEGRAEEDMEHGMSDFDVGPPGSSLSEASEDFLKTLSENDLQNGIAALDLIRQWALVRCPGQTPNSKH